MSTSAADRARVDKRHQEQFDEKNKMMLSIGGTMKDNMMDLVDGVIEALAEKRNSPAVLQEIRQTLRRKALEVALTCSSAMRMHVSDAMVNLHKLENIADALEVQMEKKDEEIDNLPQP